MSLYNALFGVNPVTPVLKEILGLDGDGPKWPEGWNPYDQGYTKEGEKYVADCVAAKHWPTGRFRDIYIDRDDKGEPKIVLYTRNGGGNREEYFWVFDVLKKHPNYIRDWDDDFDCTYAYITFSVPEKYKELIGIMMTSDKAAPEKSPSDRFKELFEKMSKGADESDPEIRRAMEVGREIFGKLNKAIEGGESGKVIEV
jgi:hypothetical protein